MAPKLRRSFHFNTIVKMYRLVEEPHIALFATRIRGPLLEEKGKRGLAIAADQPLLLPFDGEMPFPVPKVIGRRGKQSRKRPLSPNYRRTSRWRRKSSRNQRKLNAQSSFRYSALFAKMSSHPCRSSSSQRKSGSK
jgi:hypothetical protein